MIINKIILVFIALFAILPVKAKSKELLRHHVIIAVDKAGCDGWIGNVEVGQKVYKLLQKTYVPGLKTKRHYFEEGDYVSVVGFRLNANQNDMNVFVMPMKGSKGKLAYQQYSDDQLKILMTKRWQDTILQPYNAGSNGFSLVSVAKEYALAALKSEGQQVERTFLVMVTDRHYNGNNFYDEMKAFEIKQADLGIDKPLTSQDIFKRCYEVEQYYYSRYISTDYVWADNVYSPKGYVELYEYVPLQRNFTLSAAVSYPTHLKAKRKRNGDYSVELPLAWRGGNQYTFKHMEVFPNDTGKVLYNSSVGSITLDTLKDTILTFDIPSDKSARCIQLRAWLGLVDGFYNATLMSPEEDSPIELGREGLNTIIPIEYEEDATVLGVPVYGFMWPPFVNNQQTAALIWKVFLWMLFIGWLIWMAYKMAHQEYYKPRADEFSVENKER